MKKILIAIFAVLIVFAAIFGFLTAVASKLALFELFVSLTPTAPLFPKANILVLGVDDAFGHRSDTIMVLHTNPDKKDAFVVSIPRDTLAYIPGRGLDKVNHAYALGGVELSQKAAGNLLNIDLPYYIVVNLAGIVNLIDELGGITIDVEERMFYDDYAGGLHVDLQPGTQKLSGYQVMGYLRYRRDGGDLKRINRQQKFLNALADELMKKENILRSPKLFFTLLSYVDSNLNSRETLGLSLSLRAAFELGHVKMATVPGSDLMIDNVYYLKPDEKKIKEIVNTFFIKENGPIAAKEVGNAEK